jgi:sugar/nucleoside kinase (ribokinase family)
MTARLPEFVCVGEALTDMIRVDDDSDHWLARSGGSTWNVARAAASFGLRSAFAGAISRCCFGDALWRDSEAARLDLRFLQRVDRSPLLAMVPSARPTAHGRWQAQPPCIDVVDTVGAGDAAVAGLVASRHLHPERFAGAHLMFAVAAGSAAFTTAGASLPSQSIVSSMLKRVTLRE